jgi:peptide chain release factor 3
MVIDAAKGIEARTRKLFEVCRLRDIPIVTFINKLDREARDPFDLLDEIEKTLALDVAPLTWPLGSGQEFAGTYDLRRNLVRRFKVDGEPLPVSGPDDAQIAALLSPATFETTREQIALAREALTPFDLTAFLEGHLTPVFFGSALRTFGVRDLIDALAEFAPPPHGLAAATRHVEADEKKMTGFVFKIQANMDPHHRDRIAFMRICSGRLSRGMKQFFFAQDRQLAEEAYAGDIVGIPNHGTLRIGDTLTEGEDLVFSGVPSFAPEILRRVKIGDAMRAKKLREALGQMAEEGVVQLFLPHDGSGAMVGVVGALQLDVLAERLAAEYGLEVGFETPRFTLCRWVTATSPAELDKFVRAHPASMAVDLDGAPVFMVPSTWDLTYELERWPEVRFNDVKDYQKVAA